MNKNIIICGVGGQGTILASKLISTAAMGRGIEVKSAETIGMAQRGGSVFSYIRLGDHVYSPMIAQGTADVIVAFEPGEGVRMLPYLSPQGTMVVSSHPVQPVTAALSGGNYQGQEMLAYLKQKVHRLQIVDVDQAVDELGTAKVINLLLLGVAVNFADMGIEEQDIRQAIAKKIAPKFHEMNLVALDYAKEYVKISKEQQV